MNTEQEKPNREEWKEKLDKKWWTDNRAEIHDRYVAFFDDVLTQALAEQRDEFNSELEAIAVKCDNGFDNYNFAEPTNPKTKAYDDGLKNAFRDAASIVRDSKKQSTGLVKSLNPITGAESATDTSTGTSSADVVAGDTSSTGTVSGDGSVA
ncbi:unnamed protein product [Sphagnum balticum]